ncbi:MAG: metallophosphoesterase [Clostridia bacterium]|nr:metallophosphoesterase [Clostridia bacterium]
MKEKLGIIGSVLAAAIFFGVFYFFSGFWNFTKMGSCLKVSAQEQALVSSEEEMKILQLTDVQFESYLEQSAVFRSIKGVVKNTDPDLIVFTGDVLHNGGRAGHLDAFIDFMDKFQTPWAVVLGNHDYKADVSVEEQCEKYEDSEYCIFRRGTLDDSYGNYYYNLIKDGRIAYSLIFMDSGLNGFTEAQVAWYEETLRAAEAENGGETVPSFAFYHIPTVETAYAAALYENDERIGTGRIGEDVNMQTTDSRFFDTLLELGSTRAVFYGHDHVNDAILNYKGIQLCYGVKTGRTSYYDEALQGGNLITVYASGGFSVERILI